MTHHPAHLAETLLRRRPGMVCLVGGGGKTGLLFALGAALARSGADVLCTTTTRMGRPRADDPLPSVVGDDPGAIPPPGRGAVLAVVNPPPGGDSAKVAGYAPDVLDAFHLRYPEVWIIVEADGAAGRPIKAPADHEPVVPSRADVVVAVLGLSGLSEPFGDATVFRPRCVSRLTGLVEGDPLTPSAAVVLVAHPQGLFRNTPATAERWLFCNQADLPGKAEAGKELARRMAADHPGFLQKLHVGSLKTKGLRCLAFPVA